MRTLARVLIVLVAAGASGEATQQPGGMQPERITGWFSIVWGDPGPQSDQTSHMTFVLTDDNFETVELLIDEQVAARAGGVLGLNGRRVTVEGVGMERALPGQARAAIRAAAVALAADQVQMAGGADVEQAVTGAQPWASVMCKFSDVPTEPKTLSFFQGMYRSLKPGLDHYWRELSFDLANVNGSRAFGWYTLPRPRSYYIYDRNADGVADADLERLAKDCTAAADAEVYFPAYVGINMMFNQTLDCCAWGGSQYLTLDGVSRSWKTTWEPPWAYSDVSVIAHEMGHGFGLPHSSGRYGSTYDNPWDVMSADRANCTTTYRDPVYGCMAQHTIAYYKERLGWTTTVQRATVVAGALATLALEHVAAPAAGQYQVARVPIGATARIYTVEARKRIGYDSKLYGDAIIIHEVDELRGAALAQVIDADGNGNNGDAGAMWVPGETFFGEAGIKVTVNSATATGFQVTIDNNSSSSDLLPYTPAGWAAPMVISRVTGGHTDGPIYAGDALYVDGAYRNAGTAAAAPFQIAWYVDGVSVATSAAAGLAGGASSNVDDVQLGAMTVGWHTVRMVVDSGGSVPESNETNNQYVRTVYASTRPAIPGDLTGDLKSDMLWHHATRGEVWVWPMDGAARVTETLVGTVSDSGYQIVGTGDVNGDGMTDLVWHHATRGEVWVWLMNGTTMVSETKVGTVPDTGYQIVGTGDFNADGKADLVWHHTTQGSVYLWTMNGGIRDAETWVTTVWDTNYQVAAAGDYDGDGKTDLVWRHVTNGDAWLWLMDGATRRPPEIPIGTVPIAYQVVR